jgi:hypothetical protein
MGCNICNAGTYGARWTTEINLGIKKISQAAIEFNMSVEDVLTHINSHESKEEQFDIVEVLQDPDFIKREVIVMHIRLKEWLQYMIESEELGPHNMDRGIKLLKENRETLKLLADLEGKLNRDTAYQKQYIDAQNNLRIITSAVSECGCSGCKQKIFGKIKEQRALLGDGNASRKTKKE